MKQAARLGRVLWLSAVVWSPAIGQEAGPLRLDTDILPDWDISGSNTVRFERYMVDGDETTSPYGFEGPQAYDDLSLSFAKRSSPFERWQGQFSGVFNRSDYRATERNFIAERASLTWEKGDVALPYRLEVGDYFAFFSLRSIQRSLKGVQIEVQPTGNFGDELHSGVFFTGIAEPNYRDIDIGRDRYSGGSWLVEHPTLGRLNFNAVHNYRESDVAAGSPKRNQTVFSLAGERSIPIAGRKIGLETEIAWFRGDYGSGSTVSQNRSAIAYVAQIRDDGSGTPLSYSLKTELTGRDFQPNGGAVTPNQRSWELRGGWQFPNRIRLNGRLQKFTDNLQEATSSSTETAGLDIMGPVPFADGASFNMSGFVQDRKSRDKATHTTTRSATMDVGFPLPAGWTAGGNVNLVYTDDRNTGAATATRQLALRANRRITVLGLDGSLSPGLTLRNASGAAARFELVPSIAFNLAGGPHSISADYRFSGQWSEGSSDIDTQNASLAYGYRTGPHNLGVEFSLENRTPDNSASTDSYKVALFWRIDFAKPARATALPPAAAPLPATQTPTSIATFRLTGLPPGLPLGLARQRLDSAGISGGVGLAGAVVYEVRLLPDLDRRQRLALVHDHGRLTRVAWIIDLDTARDAGEVSRTYNRLRELLIRRYGSPARTFEQGRITASYAADIGAGRLILNTEWDTIAGTIRLGLPRRLDGRVRIEVQLAPAFAPARDTAWSIRSVN